MECGAVRSEINDRRRVLDERVTMVRQAPDFEPRKPLTKKQELVLAVLEEFGSVSVKELCYYSGVTRIVVENLRKAGAVELYEQIVYRDPYAGRDEEPQAEPFCSLTPSRPPMIPSWQGTRASRRCSMASPAAARPRCSCGSSTRPLPKGGGPLSWCRRSA